MEVLSVLFCSLLLATQVLQDITNFLVIFVTRGAVTCSELLYSALAVFNGLDMPRPPCRGGRSSIALSWSPGGLRPVRLGIRCCRRQSSSGCSKSQMLSMVRDRNVHLLAKTWVNAA